MRLTKRASIRLLAELGVFVALVYFFVDKTNQGATSLENQIVRIELAGNDFDIPLRYMYGKTVEKYNQWPKVVSERVKSDAISMSLLLPDLKPYYLEDDEKWKVKGHGSRIELTMMKFRGPKENWEKGIELNEIAISKQTQYYTRGDDIFGLSYYKAKGRLSDKYFSHRLQITCDSSSKPGNWTGEYYPSCMAKSQYIKYITIEYYFGLDYLHDWKRIDQEVKNVLSRFESPPVR